MADERALATLAEEHLLDLQIRLAETPAPTFHEGARAALVAERWRAAGLDPSMDAAGNVIALRESGGPGPLLAVSAHLDSVFPAEQDVRVRHPGEACEFCGATVPDGEYHGPGVADCAAGLAALVGVAEALQSVSARTAASLLFVATVGEEAAGDLKGARALFAGPWAPRIGAFVTVDVGVRGAIVHEFVGSVRYRMVFEGPGGHAWEDFGTYNPIHAAADAAARIAREPVSSEPRSSVNVGLFHAGRSVNAIPEQAAFDLDLRSLSDDVLARMDASALASAGGAHEDLAAITRGPSSFRPEILGRRPGGSVERESPLVRAAVTALADEGLMARFGPGSMDANVPAALGLPAIGFPWGGSSRANHSTRESYRSAGRLEGVRALLRLVSDHAP